MKRLALLVLLGAAPPQPLDLVIRGGTVVTGTSAPFVGDVGVRGDRIAYVGPRAPAATHVVEASGMVVAPGFIDPHSHVDAALASSVPGERLVLPFLLQGVTTAFVGNDGGGAPDLPALKGPATGINRAAYVGFGAVRSQVVGEARRAPTAAERARMQAMVTQAMCQGALGLSTGLFYAPQSFADTAEVVALAREVARRGGVYDSHLRDESTYTVGLEGAVAEAIRIGRDARLPVNISHIKALGVDVQGRAPQVIAQVERARAAGQPVTADQYPWSASGTSLVAALVPLWAQDGGRAALLRRLDQPTTRAAIERDMAENLRKRGGAAALLVTEGAETGQTLAAIAARRRLSPIGGALAVIRIHDPAVASFNQSEADIAAFMARPWVMTGSDASTGHPRVYGSFARKYREYVVRRRVLTLRRFVEQSATLAADTFGLKDRGRLAPGAFADVVVFDPARYAERATYRQPALFATGVRTVLVNGQVAVAAGHPTGRAAGRALPHIPSPGTCP